MFNKPEIFWGSSWNLRGICFTKDNFTVNVHFPDLAGLTGFTIAVRLHRFLRAWIILLSFGNCRQIW